MPGFECNEGLSNGLCLPVQRFSPSTSHLLGLRVVTIPASAIPGSRPSFSLFSELFIDISCKPERDFEEHTSHRCLSIT